MDDETKRRFDDALSYPLMTEEVNLPSNRGAGSTQGTGSSQYGQIVQSALRDILGWRTRSTDPNGFTAALSQSFELKQENGQTKWKWTPHTYAVEADLGAITGAQAAIYARAKVALDQSLPLLAGLKPLRPDPDIEDSEAIRAIVRSGLTELVHELGEQGGPRIARVDEYFDRLLGASKLGNPERLESESQLGLLRDAFGLSRELVNTIDEEQNLTNFLILVDYVTSLRFTWNAQRGAFDRRGPDVFLGTQLVLLSRALAVVAESVQETYLIMDSVFLGPAERDITEINLKAKGLKLGKGRRVFLGELLSWVEHFALEEGPRLIREGGKDGVIHSFRPTVSKLSQMVSAASDVSAKSSSNPTAAFHSVRVTRALEELSDHLVGAFKLADQIKRAPGPSVNAVVPDHADAGDNEVMLTVIGENFKRGAEVHLEIEGSFEQFTHVDDGLIFVNESQILVTFDLTDHRSAKDVEWTVVVTNPDGQEDELKAFTIGGNGGGSLKKARQLDAQSSTWSSGGLLSVKLEPASVTAGEEATLTVTGDNVESVRALKTADSIELLTSKQTKQRKVLAKGSLPKVFDRGISSAVDLKQVKYTGEALVLVKSKGVTLAECSIQIRPRGEFLSQGA